MTMDARYRMSPFLNIQSPDKNAVKLKVYNYLSGRSFELGVKAVEILRFFRKSHTIEEMKGSFALDENTAGSFMTSMLQSKLLVSEAEEELFVMETTAPKQTVFGVPGIPDHIAAKEKIVFTGVPFARGNDKSFGSEGFPERLRAKSNYLQLNANAGELINFNSLSNGTDFTRLRSYLKEGRLADIGDIYFDFKETIDFGYEKIAYLAKKLYQSGGLPFFIGGDHSITYPLVKSAIDVYGEISIIHFDAHSDTSFSKYDLVKHGRKISHTHADVMTRCMELNGFDCLYQYGIRGLANRFCFDSEKQKISWASDMRGNNGKLKLLPVNGKKYYVTIDIDVLDPCYAPGTGSYSINGLSPEDLVKSLYQVLPGLDIVGVDFVEADPSRDIHDITTQAAIEIILNMLNMLDIKTSI